MRVAEFSLDTLLYECSSTHVYGGIRETDGTPVVAKLIAGGRRKLSHEYLVLQKVTGPGVVEVLGLFEGGDGPVLVQRRFGAGSLADALRGGRFTVARALRVGLQMAQICARVHAARIVHRDIKPANVLYDADADAVAFGDFGIAIELPVNARALPVGDLVGTPGYVSPEHTGRTSEGCDFRSDLYSLGVTLYELLTGVVPFAEQDLLEVIAAHLSRTPETPQQRVSTIPLVVSEIVMKLLAKLPSERYQSARGLAADLERCLAALTPEGRIAGFELGRSDLLLPRFPQQLFGRGEEIQALERAFERASTGAPTLVLLSGREGTGRTELVRALMRDAAAGSPLALGGWSSANERPLSGLGDALGALALDLLLLDEDQLVGLRQELAARIGQAGQVVIDVAPQLGDVLGTQPPLLELTPEAARARLQHGFRSLASALGDAAPFVLALRGFEHADPASASLVHAILNSSTTCRTLIVLMAADPAGFGTLRDRADVVSIELGALPVVAVREWAAATLDCEPEDALELGEALHAKAAGNPLMVMRLLEHLVETGVIERREGAYAWSLDAVRAAPSPPTLGALASQRIAELDDDTRRTLAATACGDEPVDVAAVAAMLEVDTETARQRLTALEREGMVIGSAGCYRAAHPVIGETALAAVSTNGVARLRGRLGAHLLGAIGPAPTGAAALRVAMALSRGTIQLTRAERVHAAELHVIASEHVTASIAYEASTALLAGAAALLAAGDDGAIPRHDLQFRIDLGRIRAHMMLGRHRDADAQLLAMSKRDLLPAEIGLVYTSWCDNFSMMMERSRAVEVGLEGLERLGVRLAATPSRLRPAAAIRLNQRYLSKLTPEDHINRPDTNDPSAVAALQLLGTLTIPALFTGRMGLYVVVVETAISFILKHGHVRNMSGFLALHACFLHAMQGQYAAARRIYEACEALELARPAPELAARTILAFHYMVSPWFGPWRDSATKLASAIKLGLEAGDPVVAALCASASVTMLNLVGTPLDRVVATVEGWGPLLRGDGGVAANAANIVNIAGKLSRGEAILQGDLDRVTNVPKTAGAMRNNAMVNLGLALSVCGHEDQVRAWLAEIGPAFPQTNFSHPHRMTLWFLEGVFAVKDARTGKPERRADAERILETLRLLRRETQATNNDPAIAVLEAQLARVDGDLGRAAELFGRAVREARTRDLTPLVAYANEERARMLEEAGYDEEAT
ncbi:MAG: AAA family ATPase, partial [Kofleriaceae bacterium]